MTTKGIRRLVTAVAAVVGLYAVIGFLAVPYAARTFLVDFVERELGHRLTLGAVRFNPFTLAAELGEVALNEADGQPLLTSRRIAADLEAASLWRRAWTFAFIEADAPHVHLELRQNGRHNFSALLERLRAPGPRASTPLPRLALERIAVTEGRLDVADRQAGETAHLTLAPIAFELTRLSSEPSRYAPYRLSARSADGERIEWHGELSLNPLASSGRMALNDWKAATAARWLGNRIPLARADGNADLSFAYQAALDSGALALTVTEIEARIAGLALVGRAADEPFASLERMDLSGGTVDLTARTFDVHRIHVVRPVAALAREAHGYVDGSPGVTTKAEVAAPTNPLHALPPTAAKTPPSLHDTKAPPAHEGHEPPLRAPAWSGRIGRVHLSEGRLSFAERAGGPETKMRLGGMHFEASVHTTLAAGAHAIELSDMRAAISALALESGARRFSAKDASLSSSRVSAKRAGSALDLDAHHLAAGLAGVALTRDDAAWQIGRIDTGAKTLRLARTNERLDVGAESAMLDALGIAGIAATAAKPTVELAAAQVRAQTLALEPGAPSPALRVGGGGARLEALQLRDPLSGSDLVRLAHATLEGVSAATDQRTLAVGEVVITDAHAAASLEADGGTNWDDLLAAFGADAAAAPASGSRDGASARWQARIDTIELRSLGVALSDRRQDPPLALALEQVDAQVRDAGTERERPMQVRIRGRVRDSGRFEAAGRVDPYAPMVDLEVKVSGLSAAPLQPYAARHARVKIVSGLASAQGRLRYGVPKAGAQLVFEGDLGLDKVIVEETEPTQPLLSIDALRASRARLSVAPNRLEIPDLRLQRLVSRLLITEDQSVNFAQLVRPGHEASVATSTQPQPPASVDDPFPVTISRVRFDDSVLEFTDLSLRPQSHTRMHELEGVITGVSTSAATQARVELDARVDAFGSAQIRGSMNPFKPRRFTNVGLVFRNLEMTALTPYAAKFAGYRIASGRLSMDLRYRIRNSALTGENQIVLDQLELGERVESPSALQLPLELAIAILKDENGRIDIGVPVSGSLEDPQFSIAAVVWKAVGNLLGRVISAPFRALGGIFGATADESLGTIGFQPGVARLAPVERQKLETVLEALAQRPELTLTVKPFFEPTVDREALQSAWVRAEVLARAGIRLEPDEAPGPLDYGDARIRRAIEDLFTTAFGPPAARELRAELAKPRSRPGATAPDAPEVPATAPPVDGTDADPVVRPDASSERDPAPVTASAAPKTPGSATAAAPEAAGARNATRVARAMVRRLMDARQVEEEQLSALARSRGELIGEALRAAGKVDPARIVTAEPQASQRDGARSIEAALELGVARRKAP